MYDANEQSMRHLAQSLLGNQTASIVKSRNANMMSSKNGGSLGGTGVSGGGMMATGDSLFKQPKIPHNTIVTLNKQKSRNAGMDSSRQKLLKSSLGLTKTASAYPNQTNQGRNSLLASKTTHNFTKTTTQFTMQKTKKQDKQSSQPALMFGGTGGQIPAIEMIENMAHGSGVAFDSYRKSTGGKSKEKKSFVIKH